MNIRCILQVWFKNRRAKWRKQKREQQDAAKRSLDVASTSGTSTVTSPGSDDVTPDDLSDVETDAEGDETSPAKRAHKDSDKACDEKTGTNSPPKIHLKVTESQTLHRNTSQNQISPTRQSS